MNPCLNSRPVCEERLPKGIEARTTYAEKVGVDGMRLLDAIYDDPIIDKILGGRFYR